MTKEEILNREYTTQADGNTALLMRLFPERDKSVVLVAMDEYAKQQAMAFANYVMNDYKMSLHSESPILTDYEIYNQFIEQQNKR